MANLKVKDHDAAAKYLKASGAGTDIDPHVVEHEMTQATADDLKCDANMQVGDADVANGNPVPVSDAGGALTVDGTVTADAGAGPWPVTDNGGSLTVDGTVNVEGGNVADVKVTLDGETVDVADRAARDIGKVDIADIDGFATVQGQKAMASSLPVVVASDQSAISVDATGQGDVPITLGGEQVDISDRAARDIGKVDVAGIDAIGTVAGQKTKANSFPVVLASDEDALPVTDNAGSLSVDDGGTALEVQGDAANDAAVAGNPVLMGGYYNATPASGEEVDDGDVVRVLCDLIGGVVKGAHPGAWYADGNYAVAQTDTSVKAAPGAGLSLYVTDIIFSTDTAMNFFLESGATTIVPKIYLAANGGWSGHFQTPIKWPANTAITITSSAAGNHSILISGYTAP